MKPSAKRINGLITRVLFIGSTLIILSGCSTMVGGGVKIGVDECIDDFNDPLSLEKDPVMDCEKGKFLVTAQRDYSIIKSGVIRPKNVPLDAIEFSIKEFTSIDIDYKYIDRILLANKKGILLYGNANTSIIVGEKWYMFITMYHEDKMHLETLFWNNDNPVKPVSNALDLSSIVK